MCTRHLGGSDLSKKVGQFYLTINIKVFINTRGIQDDVSEEVKEIAAKLQISVDEVKRILEEQLS